MPPPVPAAGTISIWRTFISSSYMHPGLLLHEDLNLIQELFLEMGVRLQCQDPNIYISLDGSDSNPFRPPVVPAPTPTLRPVLPPQERFQVIFGEIEECECDAIQKAVIIKRYSLGKHIKKAVKELVRFVRKSPTSLYLEDFGFIYDFFVRYGVLPPKISEFIKTARTNSHMRHKQRKLQRTLLRARRKCPVQNKVLISISPSKRTRNYNLDVTNQTPSELESEDDTGQNGNQDKLQNGRFAYTNKHKVYKHGDADSELILDQSHAKKFTPSSQNGLVTKTMGDKLVYQCPSCLLFFTRRSGVLYHFRKKHPNEPLPGSQPDSSELELKDKKCNLCEKHFMTKSGLRHHLKNKHPEVDVADVLSRVLSTPVPKLLRTKSAVVTVETNFVEGEAVNKVYECSICAYKLKSRNGLNYHLKQKHPNEVTRLIKQNTPQEFKKVQCTLCDFRFKTLGGLRYHMKAKHTKMSGSNEIGIAEIKLDVSDNSNRAHKPQSSQSPQSNTTETSNLILTPTSDYSVFSVAGSSTSISESRKKSRPSQIEGKSITCPTPDCPVLFSRRSALFCHFRNKHPTENLPAGINYKGSLTNFVSKTHPENSVSNSINIPAESSVVNKALLRGSEIQMIEIDMENSSGSLEALDTEISEVLTTLDDHIFDGSSKLETAEADDSQNSKLSPLQALGESFIVPYEEELELLISNLDGDGISSPFLDT